MKILLDESVPQKLRLLIDSRHAVATTWFQGWSGLQNGDLLAAAEAGGYELFVTADQELSCQQNLSARRIAVLVLSTNNWAVVRKQAVLIEKEIARMRSGGYLFLELEDRSS